MLLRWYCHGGCIILRNWGGEGLHHLLITVRNLLDHALLHLKLLREELEEVELCSAALQVNSHAIIWLIVH
jgi:hypothetical protein